MDKRHTDRYALEGRAPAAPVTPSASDVYEKDVSARDVLLFVWHRRWMLLIAAVVCGLAAGIATLIVTPEYTAQVVMLPTTEQGGTMGLSSLASSSGLGGLASFMGMNLGSASAAKEEAVATLQSEILTSKYIREHNLLPLLFSKEWNSRKKKWRSDDATKIPTLWEANQLFEKKIRTVDDDQKTGLVTLTIEWKDPNTAAAWANGLVQLTNNYLRNRAIGVAERRIDYLKAESRTAKLVTTKTAIYELMELELKNEMVAKGRRDFALKVIDPAVPPERPSFPQPVLWIVAGTIGGLFFFLLGSALWETVKEEKTAAIPPTHEKPTAGGSTPGAGNLEEFRGDRAR